MRICSLLPGSTEILYSLGLGQQIVAVSDDCDLPPEVREKPIISRSVLSGRTYSSKQIDRIVQEHSHKGLGLYDLKEEYLRALKPDLIITQELCEVCAIPYSQVLKAARVLDQSPSIISLEPRTLDDILDNVILVGKLTSTEKKAEELARELRGRITKIESMARDARRPRVLCIEWAQPLMAGGHWVPQMSQIAGGVDGIARAGEWTVKLDWPKILEYQPEVIVVMPCSYTLKESMKETISLSRVDGWDGLPAVASGQVYAVNAKWYFSRSGPGLVTGLEILAEILHPEIFGRIAPSNSYSRVGKTLKHD
jgi:iron complex transport system substrate-binding protein